MLKAIVFDFDGTLIESADIKTAAFAELFRNFPDHLEAILKYHAAYAGVSRYVKFRTIYKDILKQPLSIMEERQLGDAFSKLVFDRVRQCPLVPGAAEFLDKVAACMRCFIASGTPEGELREIVDRRGLKKYFAGIYGAPASKQEILRRICREHALSPSQMLCVGDAPSDMEAAQAEGVAFLGRTRGNQWVPLLPGIATGGFIDFEDLASRWDSTITRLGFSRCADSI